MRSQPAFQNRITLVASANRMPSGALARNRASKSGIGMGWLGHEWLRKLPFAAIIAAGRGMGPGTAIAAKSLALPRRLGELEHQSPPRRGGRPRRADEKCPRLARACLLKPWPSR